MKVKVKNVSQKKNVSASKLPSTLWDEADQFYPLS